MPTLIIDDKEITVNSGATIMEAAKLLGISIPHFCYHPKLSVAGNCRMCLVEVEKMPKPAVACAQPVSEGMVVHTDSEMVRKSRKGVMEFLLINHPLDCPVCDQGGECDLQDQAMRYGPDRSRFHESKRQVRDKDIGPLIETVMNRCIQCTRCIRFSEEIAGVEEMGAVYRGDHMEVGTYVEKTLSSELAGNMAEICPVGALNLKPFHHRARGWELKKSDALCAHCSVGCHVRYDYLDNQILRVASVECEPINETWICDKGRFAYDGFSVDRLTQPQIRRDGLLVDVSWQEALDRVAEIVKSVSSANRVAGLASAGHGAEELFAFQDLLRNCIGTPHLDHRLRQRDFSADKIMLTRADLMMNTSLVDLETADLIFLVGCDSRYEAPILNLRLRKAVGRGARLFSLYPRKLKTTLSGMTEIIVPPGEEPAFLEGVLTALRSQEQDQESVPLENGDASRLAEALRLSKRPALLLGGYAVEHVAAETMRRLAVAILEVCGGLGVGSGWNGFNRILADSNAAAHDMGVVPHRAPGYHRADESGQSTVEILKSAASGALELLFLLGADPLVDCVDAVLAERALSRSKSIWIGAYPTAAMRYAEVVLPGSAVSEKGGTFANCEGRVQRTRQAVKPPGEAKEDWRILRALSDRFPVSLSYNTLEALRRKMAEADHRYNVTEDLWSDLPPPCDHSPVTTGLSLDLSHVSQTSSKASQSRSRVNRSGFILILEPSFYYNDPVVRRSATLAKLNKGQCVRINPEDAVRQGVSEGQTVRLIQEEETVEAVAVLDSEVPSGVLFGFHGYVTGSLQKLTRWDDGFSEVSVVGL